MWCYLWCSRKREGFVGIFRNKPEIKPGRWGIYIGVLEFGCRNPGDPVGLWLRRYGLWPW